MPTTYAIPNGRTVMDATIWSGDNTTPKSIVNTDNGTSGFKPDFVWMKNRTNAYQNNLYDSVRGAGASHSLSSDQTAAEGGNSDVYGYLSAFNSNGFQVTQGSAGSGSAPNGNAYTNQTGSNYVAWQWQAGQGVTSNNTSGSITSTVSANVTAGFSIVTWTGNGTNATIGHGLGVAPKMVIVKNRAATSDWLVQNAYLSSYAYALVLSGTNAQTNAANWWNSTGPTSTVFSVGNGSIAVNGSGQGMVAYCWAEIAGFSKFGSYTGNGNADGPFIYTGFRPAYVMVKNYTSGNSWTIWDKARTPYNQESSSLFADSSAAELTNTDLSIDALSNGFKLRGPNANSNQNGQGFIYMAFAETPFKYANAR